MSSERKSKGLTLRVFLIDGEPKGPKIIELSNWTGRALSFHRSSFESVASRPELATPGVYVLVGYDEAQLGQKIYIGEGDPVLPRLESHFREKEFWTWAVVFTAKDRNLNKAHIQYLEAELVSLAKQASTYTLENHNIPTVPQLSEFESAEMERFLENMLSIYPILGLSAFENLTTTTTQQGPLLVMDIDSRRATGIEAQGGFVVKAGSPCTPVDAASLSPIYLEMRKFLLKQGVLLEQGGIWVLSRDHLFNSPSQAASVLKGRNTNGRTEWKTSGGLTLRDLQEQAAERIKKSA